jgi:hypothetical protein
LTRQGESHNYDKLIVFIEHSACKKFICFFDSMFLETQSSSKLVGLYLWKCWREIKSLTTRRFRHSYRFGNLPVTRMKDVLNLNVSEDESEI